MRLIHVADLHAGKTLGKLSRNPDLAHSLNQVVDFARENRVEVLLIAGDVFDKANPDNESKEIIFDFFLRLRSIGCEAVVISGNHDSYDFMRSISGISRLANVHIFDRPDPENCTIRIGDIAFACLPYPSERVLTSADEDSKRAYGELVARYLKYLAQRARSVAEKTILIAHLFIAGSRYTKTEKVASVTLHYAVQPSSLPEEFDYIALGHVHRYQRIDHAPVPAYYTGSLYQLDFSESGDEKFFNFIVYEDDLRVEKVPLSLKNQLREIKLSQEEVLKRLRELEGGKELLKVVLGVTDREGVNHTVEILKKDLGERLIKLELDFGDPGVKKPVDNEEGEELKLGPIELYREYYRLSYGKDLPGEIEEEFVRILQEAEEKV